MPVSRTRGRQSRREVGEFTADVLVIGGGPAGAWAALAAAERGAKVILVDKGYLGTSGATAPSNTGTWFVAPDRRRQAVEQRIARTGALADPNLAHRTLDAAWENLHRLADWGYPFPVDDEGKPYLANLRGPDYMHFMRRRLRAARVNILDHHPALELLSNDGRVTGAAGVDRQRGGAWRIRAGAVVLASGGCAFGERILGASGLTGDGYLMAAEAGAALSGMEFSAQYAFTPKPSALNKGLPFRWASFTREDGTPVAVEGGDRHAAVAEALLEGPVFAQYDKASPELRSWLRQGQPNCFLPLDRSGLDPFTERWPVTLRCEGTVRGVGGIRLTSDDCTTDVPGLYAAGDAASRERLTGAISGGGGPNSSWAIASGNWAGRAAAAFASRHGLGAGSGDLTPLGQAGLRPSAEATAASPSEAMIAAVRDHMLPLDRNFFRTETTLRASLDQLDANWRELSRHLRGAGLAAVRAREAAAMTATSRWAYASALARNESRGMHRRRDAPGADPDFVCAIETSGLDSVRVTRRGLAEQRVTA
jgi:succinate dehydrogenase/fumarate reductase flavoprotein subunit